MLKFTHLILLISIYIVNSYNFRKVASQFSRFNLKMTDFNVRIINKKKNTDKTIKVPSNKFILDASEGQMVNIPYSCRAGSCSSCLGMLKEGTVDQSSQIFLDDNRVDQGYILTCVAYPTSDIVVKFYLK